MTDNNIQITELEPGHLSIKCVVSGRPLTRANKDGMFCDAPVCECELQSQDWMRKLIAVLHVAEVK